MKIGTRSLLFGVHQFIWHPITVIAAWIKLYGKPSFEEVFCIFVHDFGYWNKNDMNGAEGVLHPIRGANIALKMFGRKQYELCLYHSRSYANLSWAIPSKLCWADKLSILYDPCWFYLLRARLSGELKEYRLEAATNGFVPLSASDKEWFCWLRDFMSKIKVISNR
ncbi:MAG: hypothetical protein GX824_01790 [Clostridiales bacterium]|nr:hypothetical protein [Clostridiales bacterium]